MHVHTHMHKTQVGDPKVYNFQKLEFDYSKDYEEFKEPWNSK